MSFAYLALYTGDYLRDTRHLSCSEHGIYLLLLMHCWDSRGPVPLDERKQAGICGARSGDEIEAMRRVLNEFFICAEDGHYNRRLQLEIERANAISHKRKSAGIKGFQAKAKHLSSKSQASASTPTPTPTTTTTTTTTPTPTPTPPPSGSTTQPLGGKIVDAQKRVFSPPTGVSEKVWNDFLSIRKAKRAPMTDTALAGIHREADKAGLSLEAALSMCCERGWQGFNAEWLDKPRNDATTLAEKNRAAFDQARKKLFGETEKDVSDESERIR